MKNELTEKHHLLAESTGIWVGEEKIEPSEQTPEGLRAEGRNEMRMAAGGFARITDYTQTVEGQVTFQGHGVTVWDVQAGCYALYWFDSMSSTPLVFRGDFEGDPSSPGAFVLTGTGHGGGHQRLREELPDPNTMLASSETSVDGKVWVHAFEATYKRVG